MKQKIFFRADASGQIGYGHFIRTLALADMLKDDFECKFFTSEPTEYQIGELQKVCSYVSLYEDTKFEDFLDCLDGTEIVVLDNYFYTTEYQREIKAKGCKLVCIDDIHDKHYVADMVINHALTEESLFDVEPYTRLCLGYEYALLRSPFLKPVKNEHRNNDIIVNFGGADPYGVTDRIVSMLVELDTPYNIIVILGEKVRLSKENREKVTIRQNLSAEKMAMLFEQSAAGILSASTVCIEALSRNLPLMVGYHVDNQTEIYRVLKDSKRVMPLGFLQETSIDTLSESLENVSKTKDYRFPSGIKERITNKFKELSC